MEARQNDDVVSMKILVFGVNGNKLTFINYQLYILTNVLKYVFMNNFMKNIINYKNNKINNDTTIVNKSFCRYLQ